MKILVTGAAGFIGSHVARSLLKKGIEVIGLDNFNDYYSVRTKEWNNKNLEQDFPQNFRMARGNILDIPFASELFSTERFDKVCHIAGRAGVRESIEKPQLYEEANARGTLNLLELSRKNGIQKFVYASSSSVYGECKTVPFTETMSLKPISPYASTKLTNENDAHVYSLMHGLKTVGLRFFTVYGPSGRPDMAPFLFTKWISEGIPLKKFGNGTTSRDYTFIDDIVAGIVAALNYDGESKVFNLGNSDPISLNDFIALTEKLVGKKAIINELPMPPGDVSHTFADISLAKKELGFLPKTSLEDGMEIFIRWYRDHRLQLGL